MAATGFLFILAHSGGMAGEDGVVSRPIYEMVKWRARHGLTSGVEKVCHRKEGREAARSCAARRLPTGICGGQDMCVARNYVPRGAKGEINLVGYGNARCGLTWW